MRRHNYLINLATTFIAFTTILAMTNGLSNFWSFLFSFAVAHMLGYMIGGLFA